MSTGATIVKSGKMTESTYVSLHAWIRKKLGTPSLCVICRTTEAKRFHWANISQEYKREVSDWRRLCVSCHFIEKYPVYCKRGHRRSTENKYINNGMSACLKCKRWMRKQEYLKYKLGVKT